MRGGRGASRPNRETTTSRNKDVRKVMSPRFKKESSTESKRGSPRGNSAGRGRGGRPRGGGSSSTRFNSSKDRKDSHARLSGRNNTEKKPSSETKSPPSTSSETKKPSKQLKRENPTRDEAKVQKPSKKDHSEGNEDSSVKKVLKDKSKSKKSDAQGEEPKDEKKKMESVKKSKESKSSYLKKKEGDVESSKKSISTKQRVPSRAVRAEGARTANDLASEVALENLAKILPSLSPYEMDSLAKDDSNLSGRWTNKQRVLCLGSRGMRTAHRFLLADFKNMLPHHIPDVKWEKKLVLEEMIETADLANCNNILYLETRRKRLIMWMAKSPNGPSVKFEVFNLQTSEGTNYIGNCLKYSRPILTFDSWFDNLTQLQLIKELFIQIVGTPRFHPASKPFHDHVFSLFYNDGKIWFRHYQIFITESKDKPIELREIGPRFCLEPIRIFASAFGGKTLWKNPERFGLEPRPERDHHSSDEGNSEVGQDADIFTSDDEAH